MTVSTVGARRLSRHPYSTSHQPYKELASCPGRTAVIRSRQSVGQKPRAGTVASAQAPAAPHESLGAGGKLLPNEQQERTMGVAGAG